MVTHQPLALVAFRLCLHSDIRQHLAGCRQDLGVTTRRPLGTHSHGVCRRHQDPMAGHRRHQVIEAVLTPWPSTTIGTGAIRARPLLGGDEAEAEAVVEIPRKRRHELLRRLPSSSED